MSVVDDVFLLVAKRDLSVMRQVCDLAKPALTRTVGNELLALHEAIVDSLDALLTDLGEHGLQNQPLSGIDPKQINIREWVDDCVASWKQVEHLRSAGATSSSLINPYVGNWMYPIGSEEWLRQMRRSVAHHSDPTWIDRVSRKVAQT